MYGGQPFMIDNDIIQRPAKNIITVHGKYTVMQTNSAMSSITTHSAALVTLAHLKLKQNVLYPGQILTLDRPANIPNIDVLIEPRIENKIQSWPHPTLITADSQQINLENTLDQPIILGKDVNLIAVTPCNETQLNNIKTIPHKNSEQTKEDHVYLRLLNKNINSSILTTEQIKKLDDIHHDHKNVFDGKLSGYNGRSGKHIVSLQWADETRPKSTKAYTPNWSTAKDVILQKKIDQLTDMGVLTDPYEHDIQVKCIHPCFLQKKGRAAHKKVEECELSELRFLTAANAVNDKCRQIQTTVPDQNEIFKFIGNNKYAIYADLYESFFQNHLNKKDWGYMAINSPYKGLRVYTRSTQGLLNQDEELSQLLFKVLGTELMNGICMKIADDLIVGGNTVDEAINNWNKILDKLSQANLKLSPGKVRIFPKTAQIYGWQISDHKITPDPHRQLALSKTKHEDLKTIGDVRSWMGVYKTFLIAMPGLAATLDPFDKLVAGVKDSKTLIHWSPQLIEQFTHAAQRSENCIQHLALPNKHEQLILMPDATVRLPAIGFTLSVVRDGNLLPVIFYSFKLNDHQKDWWPCEREALGVATAIKKCSHYIIEATKPVLVLTDSKPVVEAAALIKQGKFSASSRMSAFLCSINRYRVDIQHISGKLKHNIGADYLSRNPASCTDSCCQICRFLQEISQCIVSSIDTININNLSVIDAGLKTFLQSNNAQSDLTISDYVHVGNPVNTQFKGYQKIEINAIEQDNIPIGNKTAWSQLQSEDHACREAYKRLTSGQQPNKRGPLSNDIRKYYNNCQAKEMLVVEDKIPHTTQTRYRMVVPKEFIPAVIAQLHHREQNHLSAYQLEKLFNKYYFGIQVKQVIEETINSCMLCKSTKFLKPNKPEFQPKSQPTHPGQIFNIDVMRRHQQKIMICRDIFSSYTTIAILKSEQSNCLLKGIIECVANVRAPNTILIRTDSAPGFKGLVNNTFLEKLDIQLEVTDSSNKNSIATVDNAIKEIEEEIIKIAPHSTILNETTLAMAAKNMNLKIRNRGLSAYEIVFSRDNSSQQNLNLKDNTIANEQIRIKQINNKNQINSKFKSCTEDKTVYNKGDTVAVIQEKNKTNARDVYLVTKVHDDKLQVNKIIRFHSDNSKLQSKTRIVPRKSVYKITENKTPIYETQTPNPPIRITARKQTVSKPVCNWSPFTTNEDYTTDIDSENEDNNHQPEVNNQEDDDQDDDDGDDNDDQDHPDIHGADDPGAGRDHDNHDENPKTDPYAEFKIWENNQRMMAKSTIDDIIDDQSVDWDHNYDTHNVTYEEHDDEDVFIDAESDLSPMSTVQTVDTAVETIIDKLHDIRTDACQNLDHVLPIPPPEMIKLKKKRVSPPRRDLPLETEDQMVTRSRKTLGAGKRFMFP